MSNLIGQLKLVMVSSESYHFHQTVTVTSNGKGAKLSLSRARDLPQILSNKWRLTGLRYVVVGFVLLN